MKKIALGYSDFKIITGRSLESIYHAFILGLLLSLNKTHQVLSNRESGYGRYDVMVIPRDITKIGIIIEFKKYSVPI